MLVPPPLRWTKRVAKAALVLIALLALVRWAWGRYADARLAEAIAEARALGQPFSPEDFRRPGPPLADADNAAVLLEQAGASVKVTTSASMAPRWDFSSVSELRAFLEANAGPLAQLRASRSKPVDWRPEQLLVAPGFAIFPSGTVRLSDVVDYAARLADVDGNHAETIELWRDALFNACVLRQHPTLDAARCAQAVASELAGQVFERSANVRIGPAPAASRAQVESFIAELLDERGVANDIARMLAAQRWMTLDVNQRTAAGQCGFHRAWYGRIITSTPEAWERAVAFAAGPAIRIDAARWMRWETSAVAALEAPDFATARQRMRQIPWPMEAPLFTADFLTSLHARGINSEGCVFDHFRTLAQRRAAAVALAIRIYRADHDGAWPATLDVLALRYIPALPKDPFDPAGKPLRYLPLAGRQVIYSVGKDGLDDLASGRWTLPPQRVDEPFRCPDYVFEISPLFPAATIAPSDPK
jgi:hypothetical protein